MHAVEKACLYEKKREREKKRNLHKIIHFLSGEESKFSELLFCSAALPLMCLVLLKFLRNPSN